MSDRDPKDKRWGAGPGPEVHHLRDFHPVSAPREEDVEALRPDAVLEMRERVKECRGQIEESPYTHTTAAGWYAQDVPALVAEVARLSGERDRNARKVEAYDNARVAVKIEGNSRAYYVLRAENAEAKVERLREALEHAERALADASRIIGAQSVAWVGDDALRVVRAALSAGTEQEGPNPEDSPFEMPELEDLEKGIRG